MALGLVIIVERNNVGIALQKIKKSKNEKKKMMMPNCSAKRTLKKGKQQTPHLEVEHDADLVVNFANVSMKGEGRNLKKMWGRRGEKMCN